MHKCILFVFRPRQTVTYVYEVVAKELLEIREERRSIYF
jgi:hypothetical protein